MRPGQPHHVGHRRRLRDRFINAGFEGFGEHEVVELLLTLALPRGDTKPAAKALLERFGSLRGILDALPQDVQAVQGVAGVTAINLKVIRAAATLYLQQSSEGREVLKDFSDFSDFWRAKIGMLQHEVFAVAYLDSAHKLMPDPVDILQVGTINRAAVYPREVIKSALRREAAAVVLAHNHPNGDVQPSEQDKLITRAIVLAAETVELRILDHLVVSQQETFSFREAGLL